MGPCSNVNCYGYSVWYLQIKSFLKGIYRPAASRGTERGSSGRRRAEEAAPTGRPSLVDLHVGLDLCIKCVSSICYLKGKIWVSWTYGSIVEQPLYVVNEHAGHHWPTVQYSALYICISYNWRDISIYGQLCTCHDKREWWLRQLSIKYRKSNWNV